MMLTLSQTTPQILPWFPIVTALSRHCLHKYAYNARNQLTTMTSGAYQATFAYDNNGSQVSVTGTVGANNVYSATYTYDQLNRMLTTTTPAGTETFTYRGAEWHRASMTANGVTTSFLYSGDNVVADIQSGAVTTQYVTPFLDQNLSMTRGGVTYYYTQDGLGSVRTLTDTSGNIANNYDYAAFGEKYAPGTSETVSQRYTYTGRERNAVSGTQYNRWRTYFSNIGRWGSRNPIGYAAGINLYEYVRSSPVRWKDPFGLVCGIVYKVGVGRIDHAWLEWSYVSPVTLKFYHGSIGWRGFEHTALRRLGKKNKVGVVAGKIAGMAVGGPGVWIKDDTGNPQHNTQETQFRAFWKNKKPWCYCARQS